jgi:hypothetical protein
LLEKAAAEQGSGGQRADWAGWAELNRWQCSQNSGSFSAQMVLQHLGNLSSSHLQVCKPPGPSFKDFHQMWCNVTPGLISSTHPPCLSELFPTGMVNHLEICLTFFPLCSGFKNVLVFVFSLKNFRGKKDLGTVGTDNEKSRIGWGVTMSGDLEE